MAGKTQDRLDRMADLLERLLDKLAPDEPAWEGKFVKREVTVPTSAARTVRVIPNGNPELVALRGMIRHPSKAKRIDRFAEMGPAVLTAYIDGGSAYANAYKRGEKPLPERKGLIAGSTAHAYATTLLRYVEGDGPVRTAGKLRTPTAEVLKSANMAVPLKLKQPKPTDSQAAWLTWIKATTDCNGLKATSIRGRAWRAREVAIGRDPYRSK